MNQTSLYYNSIMLKMIWKDTRASAVSLSHLKGLQSYSFHPEMLVQGGLCSFSIFVCTQLHNLEWCSEERAWSMGLFSPCCDFHVSTCGDNSIG